VRERAQTVDRRIHDDDDKEKKEEGSSMELEGGGRREANLGCAYVYFVRAKQYK
jgi:hypothetical protein